MTRQLLFTFRFAIRESVEGVKGSIANPQQVLPLSEVALNPMLSATRKLAMTHRSISSLDFGSVAVCGEGLAWPCPPTWRKPGAMNKSAHMGHMGP